jgi:hypothetical protein
MFCPTLLKIHGTIDNMETLVLGTNDYRDVVYNNRPYQQYLEALLTHHTVFFVGFSFADPDLRQLLDQLRAAHGAYTTTHYALMDVREVPPVKQKRFERAIPSPIRAS